MPQNSFRQAFLNEFSSAGELVNHMLADEALISSCEQVTIACLAALKSNRKILLAGNGGSAADAQHVAAEIVSRFAFDRPGLPAIALTTDSSILTAIGNDYGFEQIFSRQIEALGQADDVFIAYSTSGNSANIVRALHSAKQRGLVTVGMTGNRNGQMLPLCDYAIQVPSDKTPRIQEGHLLIEHILCAQIEIAMFKA